MFPSLFTLGNIISIPLLVLLYVYLKMERLPKNRPENYKRQDNKKVIVLAGDSITHGQIGENYVSMLAKYLDASQFDFVNAGINSHLAWNLLQRVDEIIRCDPDYVTILIGTNDANAARSEEEGKGYKKRMKLPRLPDQEWYKEALYEIVTTLQEKTHAKIGLISIPPIGEDPEHLAYKISSEYVKSIEAVSNQTGVKYIPFHEMMVEYLEKHPGNPTYPIENSVREMIVACSKNHILKRDWDSIGKAKGFQLHIDYLHLNTKSASMLTNLIEEFIKSV